MFQLLEVTVPALLLLPVEMIAMVLRYLDGDSLLNTAITNKYLMGVCKGDPVLRKRIQTLFQKRKELEERIIMDARMGVSITRTGPSRMFGTNVEKVVVVERPTITKRSVSQQLQAKPFTVVADGRKKGGGKIRQQGKNRAAPYKSFRC